MAFVSSSSNNTSSSNETVNVAHEVTTASTQVNTAYSTNIDNLSDAIIYSFFDSLQNLVQQLAHDDFNKSIMMTREMDLMDGQMAIAPRNQDNKNKESSRRSVPVETSTSTALVSCDGLGGYDWSDQAEEGPNYALMAYSSSSSDSEVSNDSNCLKSCMETVKLLKSQNDQLLRDLEKSSLMVLGYKTGLESVEEKLEFYKKNESVYVEKINGLKWDIQVGEITIRELRKKLEKIQKEKDSIQFNVDKFENASKSLDKLIECQIVDNCKKGLGYEKYNAVPPPYTGNFMPPTPDMSFTSLDEFANKPVVENSKAMSSEEDLRVVRKSDDAPNIEDWVSDNEKEDVSQPKIKKKIVKTSIIKKEYVKSKQQEKSAKKTVKQVEHHRQNSHSPRGNQRNWNNMMSQKLGSSFEMFNKACYLCGSFDHLQVDCNYHQKQFQNQRMIKPVWNNAQRVNHQNFAKKTYPYAKKNMVPRAVLMKSGLVSVNTARQNISKTALSVNTARQVNAAHSKTTINATRPMVCTTASSFEVEQDSVNIAKTDPRKHLMNLNSPEELLQVTPLESGEDSLKRNELMELCTNFRNKSLIDWKDIRTQVKEIISFKEEGQDSLTKKECKNYWLKRLTKLVLPLGVELLRDEESMNDADMFDVNTLTGDEVLAEQEVATKDVNLTVDEVTLAQELTALKSVKTQGKFQCVVVEQSYTQLVLSVTKVSADTNYNNCYQSQLQGRNVITKLGDIFATTRFVCLYAQSQCKFQDIKAKEKMCRT
ncbi:hypothetical protein Tco_0667463 [Tanacetum coccineum]